MIKLLFLNFCIYSFVTLFSCGDVAKKEGEDSLNEELNEPTNMKIIVDDSCIRFYEYCNTENKCLYVTSCLCGVPDCSESPQLSLRWNIKNNSDKEINITRSTLSYFDKNSGAIMQALPCSGSYKVDASVHLFNLPTVSCLEVQKEDLDFTNTIAEVDFTKAVLQFDVYYLDEAGNEINQSLIEPIVIIPEP